MSHKNLICEGCCVQLDQERDYDLPSHIIPICVNCFVMKVLEGNKSLVAERLEQVTLH